MCSIIQYHSSKVSIAEHTAAHSNAAAAAMHLAPRQQDRVFNKCIDAGGALHAACKEADCIA